MPAPSLSRPLARRLPLALAAAVAAASLAVVPLTTPAARAADTDLVAIPDATLRAAVNAALGTDRTAGQDVTVAEAATLTSLTVPAADDAASSLIGLEAFTRLSTLTVAGDRELTDLSPLSGLPLTTLSVTGGAVQGTLDTVGRLTTLTTLRLTDDRISDLSGLGGLNRLTTLQLPGNEIRDLAPLRGLPQLTTVDLASNRIQDVDPLTSLTNPSALQLADNRIEDPSALRKYAALRLGTTGNAVFPPLQLEGNRVRDFSAFSGFITKPRATGQTVHVGPYQSGGVLVVLSRSEGRPIVIQPVDPTKGAYDQATGTLTLADPTTPSIELSPNWTVRFADAPVDPTVTGTATVGQVLTAHVGSETRPSCEPAYQWRREGVDLAGATAGTYVLTSSDVGSRISVQVTCGGQVGISAPSASVMATTPGAPVIVLSQNKQTGVVGDPTNPGITLRVGQTDTAGKRVDPSLLTVTATGGVPATVTGSGPVRRVSFDAQARGNVQVNFTVTGAGGATATEANFNYATSIRTTPSSRVLIGQGDSSTALDAGAGHLFVADDERSELGLYDPEVSGRAVWESEPLQGGEVDFEASARKGDTTYWFGSHGNKKDGAIQSSRRVVYRMQQTGTGADARLVKTGSYQGLRSDLIAWDRANGDRLGLAAATAEGVQPDRADGFNLEGAEFSPDGSELYLGFRSPAIMRDGEYQALIVPVTNFEDLFTGAARKAEFGDPILLDLDGHDVREIRKNDAGQYLIISGTPGMWTPQSSQTLFSWTGHAEDPAVPLSTVVPKDLEPTHTDNAGAWEGIGALPEDLVEGSQVRLIMDQGYDTLYSGTGENKKADLLIRKARTDVFTLAGNLGLKADVAGSGAFADRAANTISPPQTITLTNTGSERVRVAQVSVRSDTGQADDFLVSTNTCAYTQPGPGATCTIGVRFAPSAERTTSVARLVIDSNLPGAARTVALTGTSTTLPQGPVGPPGPAGPQGITGPHGPAGTVGFGATKARVVAARGGRAKVAFTIHNRTGGSIQAVLRATTPSGLRAVGRTARTTRIASLDAGQRRQVAFTWRVGKSVKLGHQTVKVRIQVGDLAVTRTVVVRVVRR